ncbi:MAG: hypothetical protein AB7S38_33905 [Vulcanimicrobiota bacterium]
MSDRITPVVFRAYTAPASPKKGLSPSAPPPEPSERPPIDQSELGAPVPMVEVRPATLRKIGLAATLGLVGLGALSLWSNLSPQPSPPPASSISVSVEQPAESPSVLTQLEASPAAVVATRDGQLLSAGRILKFDQYPGLQNGQLPETIEGAPNFRGVDGTSIYGVAQPTEQGLRAVLDRLGAKEHSVTWATMREEPVVYVNGRSYSLRLEAQPFANFDENSGITTAPLERQEEQLQQEVLREAANHGGKILLHGEAADGSLVAEWVDVTSVKTPQEVFAEVKAEGYQVNYARIPITDEKAPEDRDFDALVATLKDIDPKAPLIFNCHAGRGRTTTAMVVADLLRSVQAGKEQTFTQHQAVRGDIGEQGNYEQGEYRIILRLIQALQAGPESKGQTDESIDRFAAMQNLRTAIEKYKDRAAQSTDPGARSHAEETGLDYLHRYFKLINFDEYLHEQAPKGFEQSYEEWFKARPDLQEMLGQMELALNVGSQGQTQYA